MSSLHIAAGKGLKLNEINSGGAGGSARTNIDVSPHILSSPSTVLSPDSVTSPSQMLSPHSPFSPYAPSYQIDYKVYPKDIQDLVAEFIEF